jgi:hypothetical protein
MKGACGGHIFITYPAYLSSYTNQFDYYYNTLPIVVRTGRCVLAELIFKAESTAYPFMWKKSKKAVSQSKSSPLFCISHFAIHYALERSPSDGFGELEASVLCV